MVTLLTPIERLSTGTPVVVRTNPFKSWRGTVKSFRFDLNTPIVVKLDLINADFYFRPEDLMIAGDEGER